MEKEIKVVPEQNEQIITPTKEPFLLTKTQNKSVPLDMAEGDQRIIPDAGYLLQSVIVEKPDTLIPDNILKDVNIGGVIGIYEGAVLPDVWESSFLVINHTTITVGANSVNTTLGVKDYILDAAGTENGRLLAFCLREKSSYSNGEIGRCVLYPNSGIGYFSCTQWNGSSWVAGRMLSGYSAVLPVGGVYDVYYWGLPS